MEKMLTHKILDFNWKVKEESDKLEDMAKAEFASLKEQISIETEERAKKDQESLENVKKFLVSLK